jgi:hypothetical protein
MGEVRIADEHAASTPSGLEDGNKAINVLR